MGSEDLETLASALSISDDDLANIQSKFKKKEGQAHQLFRKWHRETNGTKQDLYGILTATRYQEVANV